MHFIYSTYSPTALLNTSPHLLNGILVGVTHNLELPTERTLPSSLSRRTSTPVLSQVTTSTGLIHALCYGFIIFVLIYSVTLLDVRPQGPVHNGCVSAYLYRGNVFGLYCLHFHKLPLPDQTGELYTQLQLFCLLECRMHATHRQNT